MKLLETSPVILCCLLMGGLRIHAAETPDAVFTDDFENRREVGRGYKTSLGDESSWRVIGGVLSGKQTKPDHGAVIRRDLTFADIDLEFDFRFSGGTSFNFVIDDEHDKSVHAGHICRVSISPKRLNIGDDKTGSMNLEVRERRANPSLPAGEKMELAKLLAATQSAACIRLERDTWYTLRVHLSGSLMEAFIDGNLIAKLDSPGLAHPTKTKFGLTVNGNSIDFDNLKVSRNPR